MTTDTNTFKAEFDRADGARQAVLTRARECAAMTIPSVLPDEGLTGSEAIVRAYQSLGADGAANMVNKMLVSIFSDPWFRYSISASAQIEWQNTPEVLAELEAMLYVRERQIRAQLEATKYRIKMRTMMEQLIVVGNALAKMTASYTIHSFRFDQFVWRRASDGELLWLITHEKKDRLQLSEEDIAAAAFQEEDNTDPSGDPKDIDLYTKCERQRDSKDWLIRQEINGHELTHRRSEEPVSPYFTSGYVEIPGEHYSRSYVEEKIGDLRAFNGLSKALLDGTVAAARMYPVVDPSGTISHTDLTKANGTVLVGRVVNGVVQSVGFIKTDKGADLQVGQVQSINIEERLGKQFLMETEAMPTGDRVTATQIMKISGQLDGARAGVYSEIAEELQRPLITRVIWQMERDGILVPLPEYLGNRVDVELLTGLSALGRQMELEKMTGAMQITAQIPGAVEHVHLDRVLTRIWEGYDVDTRGLVKTKEEFQAEVEARMEQQMQMAAQQEAITTAGAVVKDSAKEQAKAAATADTAA